ncbi:MAG TPA: response regulator transcription factor [Pedococcus sp.]|nr:response regulator transcription factor [Pedococcus sp.]
MSQPPTTPSPSGRGMRAALVDDSSLFRQGLANLLTAAGIEVVAELSDAQALPAVVHGQRPDVVLLDVRMPPTHTDEGINAAIAVRAQAPDVGVLVLSTYAEGVWARRLFEHGATGLGYLLKDRVDDVVTLVDALRRVAGGGTAVDPQVVSGLLSRGERTSSALNGLSAREREVLALMAQGMSNGGIGQKLFLSPRTVETHVTAIFDKLPLRAADHATNRRVLAVLTYLDEEHSA